MTFIAVLLGAVALLLVVLGIGAMTSLDWRRSHAAETARLASFNERSEDGLTRVAANGCEFRARVVNANGDGDGVLLLHGFPQTSAAWEPVLNACAKAGLSAVAMDQRGYSPTARPQTKYGYSLDKLIQDVLAVADAVGFKRFHLVGHDWGAAVAWGLAMQCPERVQSLTALSVPHSYAFGAAVRTDPDQRRRSRYFLLFRTPILAELLLSFARLRILRKTMYQYMPEAHAREYLRVLSEPGALTGALNWYRAVGLGGTGKFDGTIHLPTLFIWGNRDPAVGRKAVELQAQYLHGPHEVVELDAGHWLLEHRTDAVVPKIVAHISQYADGEVGSSS